MSFLGVLMELYRLGSCTHSYSLLHFLNAYRELGSVLRNRHPAIKEDGRLQCKRGINFLNPRRERPVVDVDQRCFEAMNPTAS